MELLHDPSPAPAAPPGQGPDDTQSVCAQSVCVQSVCAQNICAQNICVCPECGCPLEDCPRTPGEHAPHPHHPYLLDARNLMAILAAVCFAVSLLLDHSDLPWKAVAYGLGAVAYIGELLAVTHLFRHRCTVRELFMPLLFGFMYIVLGLNYALPT